MATLDKAIAITAEAFVGRFDKGGKPYILHCLYVMEQIKHTGDDEIMMSAIMHDLVEDTNYTVNCLGNLGFSLRVQRLVDLLTHNPNDSYDEYLERIKSDKDAIKIKLGDLKHNSQITRMKGLGDKDFARLEKYCKAYADLKEVL